METLNRILAFFKRLRRDRVCRHPLIRDYLRAVQRELDQTLNCKSAYGGSIALYLHGVVPTFGDFDIVTDKIFAETDLPWEVNSKSLVGLKVHSLGLDIFFNSDRDNKRILELSNKHITEVDGIRVQDLNFILNINRLWHEEGGKQRRLIELDKIDHALMANLRVALS